MEKLKKSKKKSTPESEIPKKKTVFDHVKHIRQTQDPLYYKTLSDTDKQSFNHFMILRALSMDPELLDAVSQLYQVFDKIPSQQFYQLLTAIVPLSNEYHPWIKTKKLKHNQQLLEIVSKKFDVPTYQANEYVNLLLRITDGDKELEEICRCFGLTDKEIDALFDEDKKYE